MTPLARHLAVALGMTACSSISDSDPSLWTPTRDLGRSSFQPSNGSGIGGAAENTGGNPSTETGGRPIATPETGGSIPTGTGGAGGMPIATGGFGQGATAGSGSGGIAPGTGGSSGGTGGARQSTGGSSNSGKCTFTVNATTVRSNGRYTPRNAGAIWITDATNVYVKTLRIWSPTWVGQVTAWVQSSNSNTTDAITGATRPSDGTIDATTWDCTNVSHAAVADGQYTVHISFADQDANPFFGTPIQASVNFLKSQAGDDVSGQDTPNIKSIHARLTIP